MLMFILNEIIIETKLKSESTVLDFVQYSKRLTSIKKDCREGDYGACTILVSDFDNEKLVYPFMTSCLMPLRNPHGKHIVSAEGINNSGLNAVCKLSIG
jgi:xanthine dehydrogenase iron-sulfur cluster and FAD-binding subunit A